MNDILLRTFYFWGVLLILPIWAYIFDKRKSSRREMLMMGILFGIAGVLIGRFYAIKDYWHPPYIFGSNLNFEDFLYGFIFGGISCELYETLSNEEDSKSLYKKHYFILVIFGIITFASFSIIVNFLKFNSIWGHIVPPLIVGFCIVGYRHDLLKASILSGIYLTLFLIAWYIVILIIIPGVVNKFWYTQNLLGVYFIGIPIEEFIFAFALGFGGSNVYEFVTGRKIVKIED